MWRLTDEQRELRERIRECARAEIRPRMLLKLTALPIMLGGSEARSNAFCRPWPPGRN